jgi:hypothetical protein
VSACRCVLCIDTRSHIQNITMFNFSPLTLYTCSLIPTELLSKLLKGYKAAYEVLITCILVNVNRSALFVLIGRHFLSSSLCFNVYRFGNACCSHSDSAGYLQDEHFVPHDPLIAVVSAVLFHSS